MYTAMDLDHDACYRAVETRDSRFDGRFFTAVKTTGIYCRPVCPARTPKRENVVFYVSAAAAQEAGFRPCLRCRPETSPDLGAWRGASNTVSRALVLIEAGALDEGDVETLAGRLGVGGRQLRRLFRQHLGASPIAVAQTRRLLLAKQLIHETSLSMTEVALASGFGSVRRFNETFQQLYDRPPIALRRATLACASATSAVTLKLPYKPPYDWAAMLAFLAPRAIPGVEVIEGGAYARAIAIGGAKGAFIVRPAANNRLAVTVQFPKLEALPAIIARVRRLFDLAADPLAIGDHLSQDAHLAPLVATRPGLRVPGAWDGFEVGVRAILGQQITVTAAIRIAGKIAAQYGAPLDEPIPGLSRPDPHLPLGRDAGPCRPLRPAHATCPFGFPFGIGQSGRRRSETVRPQSLAGGGDHHFAPPARHWRMDRPIHRHARIARTRCFSRRRHRADTGHGR